MTDDKHRPMRSPQAIKRQRTLLTKAVGDMAIAGDATAYVYGAQVALDWVLGLDDLSPVKAFHGENPK